MLNLFVGYDPREAAVYHTFCQSVIEHASAPVRFVPLAQKMFANFDGQRDGTNQFIYSRYLIPHLQNYVGWAIFCDGDMLVTDDIYKLYDLRDNQYAVQVVKHHYQTEHPIKYYGTPLQNSNIDYPRKNWSSVVIYNCAHQSNRVLTERFVNEATGALLHRFGWLRDEEIGALPDEWNHLVGEYKENPRAKLYHHTLGSPGFEYYAQCESSKEWNRHLLNTLRMEGERPFEMVRRAQWHRTAREYAA